MKAVFDRNLRKMMCVSLTLLAKSCKILSDRKWFKMTHFQKWKAIFNFLKRKLFLNIFVKLNKKAARKLQTCIWYLRNALQNSTSVGSIYAKLKILNEFYPLNVKLDQTLFDILNFIVSRTRKSLKNSKYLQRNS